MATKPIEFDAVVSANQINRLLADLRSGAEGTAKAINDALGGTVTKKIVFQEVVNDKGIKQLVATEKERLSVADQLINRQKQLNKTQEGSKTNLQQQLNTLRQQRDGVARYETAINSIGGSVRRQTAEWTALNAQVSSVSRQLDIASASGFWQRLKVETRTQGLINIGNGLVEITQQLQAASIIIGQFTGAINALVDSAAQIQSFNLAFKAIGAGGGAAAKALQESSRIALGLGVDLTTVQEGFKQLAPVVFNIGGTLGDVSGVVESLSSRFAAFGISGDRARRVTNGIIQAFAKGKLQAEELTQQISESDPAFKTDFAKALFAARGELGKLGKEVDGTTANLEKLVKAGRITGDVLLKVLPGLSKSSLLFGKLGPTAGTAVNALEKNAVTIDQVRANLKNLNQLSLRNLAQSAQPLIVAFLRVQAVVVDFFSRISKSSAFEAFANIAARIVEVLTRLADTFFVVIEGALKLVEAIKPVLDLLANIPGLAEIAGVALVGKLLGPLKLLNGRIEKTKTAWTGFANVIGNVFGSPREAIRGVTTSIKEFQDQLNRPTTVKVSTRDFKSELTSVAAASDAPVRAIDQIDSKISEVERRISGLRRKLDAELTRTPAGGLPAQAIASTGNEQVLRDLIFENESKINELRSSAVSIRESTAASVSRVAIDVDDLQDKVDDGIDALTRLGTVRESALAFKPRQDPNVFRNFEEKELRQYLQTQKEGIENFNKLADAGDLAGIAAARGVDLAGKSQKQVNDFLSLTTSAYKTQISLIKTLEKEFQKRGLSFEVELVGDTIASNKLSSIESQIKTLEAATSGARLELEALQNAASSDTGKAGLAVEETKRQKKLREEIRKSSAELQDLYAEQARQGQGLTQTRRQQVGFEPGAISQLQKFIDLRKEEIKQSILSENLYFTELGDREKEIRSRLRAIEEERRGINQGFPGIRIGAGDFRTEEIRNLTSELKKLQDVRGEIASRVSQFAAGETNIAKILEDGSAESATFAQRQRALNTLFSLSSTVISQNGKEIDGLKTKYRELSAERRNLLKQQAARSFTGSVTTSDPLIASLAANRQQQDETRASIVRLRAENIAAIRAQKQYSEALDVNGRSADTVRGALSRAASTARGLGRGLAGAAVGGTKVLAAGLSSILSLLDPITAGFLALGVASRLYADGNREAAATASEFKQTLDNLASVRADILPALPNPDTASNALDRAYRAISVGTVKFVDGVNAKLKELGVGFFGFVENIRKQAPALKNRFVEIAGSILLVSGAAAAGAVGAAALAGALAGGAVGAPTGPGAIFTALAGAAIAATAAIIGLTAATGNDAKNKLDQLTKSLKELKDGSRATATEIESLSTGLLEDINITPGVEVSPESIERIKKAIQQAKEVRDQIQNSLDKARGAVAGGESRVTQLEAELKAEKQKLNEIVRARKEAAGAPGARGSKQADEVRRLASEEDKLRNSISEKNNVLEATKAGNKQLGETVKALTKDNNIATQSVERLSSALKKGQSININFADTINEIDEVIKTLTEENKGLKLTDPGQRRQLDDNLNRIKSLQRILEETSKTKYEITVEVRNVRGAIAEAQTRIDIKPGDLRDTVDLARKSSDEIANAQDEFSKAGKDYNNAVKSGSASQKDAAAAIERAGLKFLETTRTAAANLIDKARELTEKLQDSQNSLTNLKLSNPNFFTEEELQQNAQGIEEAFTAAVEKVRKETGNLEFFPKLEGKTPKEILEQKQRFVETRGEVEKLTESINQINSSLVLVTAQLAKISGIEINSITGGAKEIKRQIDLSRTGIDAISSSTGQIARIGNVFGTISGGGKELIIYYDNVKKSVEQVTAAEFKALQQADKLAKSGAKVGESFSSGTTSAISSVEQIGNRVGQVFGSISANGKTQVIYFDKISGKIESISESAFERLKNEKALTKEGQNQLELNKQIAAFQTRDARTTGTTPSTSGQKAVDYGGVAFLPSNLINEQQAIRQSFEIGKRVGGNFLKVLAETIRTGGVGFFPELKLNAILRDVSSYRTALENVRLAQEQASEAQKRYNDALDLGVGDITGLGAAAANSTEALATARRELDSSKTALAAASVLARQFGIDLDAIPQSGEYLPSAEDLAIPLQRWEQYVNSVTTGSQQIAQQDLGSVFTPLEQAAQNAVTQSNEALSKWNTYAEGIKSSVRSIGAKSEQDPLAGLADSAGSTGQVLQGAVGSSESISGNLEDAAAKTSEIRNNLLDLNGTTIEVFVKQRPIAQPYFTGGPIMGGQQVQVNELGKEGFLSAGGKLSPINVPAYGLWRAPGAGTVIPAHIMEKLAVPQTGTKVNTNGKTVNSGSGVQQVMRTIAAAVNASRSPENAINELTIVQANQAIQIGKLSRAVNKLTEKDWNVNVSVRPNSSTNYIDRLNRKL